MDKLTQLRNFANEELRIMEEHRTDNNSIVLGSEISGRVGSAKVILRILDSRSEDNGVGKKEID